MTKQHSKKLLRAAIFNDTLFLQRNDVMDYSLMVAVDEARKELVVGIIDVVRTYTWVCQHLCVTGLSSRYGALADAL